MGAAVMHPLTPSGLVLAMEAALLLLDSLAVAVLVFTSLRNDRLRADQPTSGPFRFLPAPPAAPLPGRRQRGRRPAIPGR